MSTSPVVPRARLSTPLLFLVLTILSAGTASAQVTGAIGGRITDESSGAPVAGATVRAYDTAGFSKAQGTSDATGSYYVVGLPAGDYYVAVTSAARYILELYPNLPCPTSGCPFARATLVRVASAATTGGIDFALSPKGEFSGRLLRAADGTPMSTWAYVSIYDVTGRSVGSVSGTGTYSVTELMPGTYYAMAESTGFVPEVYGSVDCHSSSCVTSGTPIVVTSGAAVPNVDFSLHAKGIIRGIVKGTDGSSVSSARVNAYSAEGSNSPNTFTDANGNYEFGLDPGTYYVRTNASGYLNEVYDGIACPGTCDVTAGKPLTIGLDQTLAGIDFVLDVRGQITGTVTAAATGLPVASATMYATAVSDGASYANAVTDANGTYTLTGLPAGEYRVWVSSAGGYVRQVYPGLECGLRTCPLSLGTGVAVATNTTASHIDFSLAPGGVIGGGVIDKATGLAVTSTRLQLHDSDGSYYTSAYANAQGQYSFNGLPTGSYYVLATDSKYQSQVYQNTPCPTPCTVTAGTAIPLVAPGVRNAISFAMDPLGGITGTVSTASGPLGSARVYIYAQSGSYSTSATTDGSGRYTVGGLASGTYYAVTSNTAGYLDQMFGGAPCPLGHCTATAGSPIAVVAGQPPTTANFTLITGGSIRGTVTNRVTGLVISATLTVYDATGASISTASTSSGSYELKGLAAGSYFVRARSTGYEDRLYRDLPCPSGACAVLSGTPVPVALGQATSGVDCSLNQYRSISGRITDAAGTPLADASVRLYRQGSSSSPSNTFASSSGTYSFGSLSPGTYYVRASSDGYLPQVWRQVRCLQDFCVATAGTALDLTFQADITGINFSLERGPVIGGLIADRATQAGIAGATVTISRPDGTTVASMMSSSSGFYRIVDLEPGMYYVQAGRTDYVGTSYGGSDCQPCATVAGAPLRLVAGQPPVTLNFTLTRGASISGRVTKAETGNAVSSAIVELYDSAGIRVLYAVTPVSGAYSIRGLPPGSYYLRASGQGVTVSYPDAPCVGACNPVSGTPIVVQAGAALAGFDFALRDGVSFSGTVLKGQSRYAGAVIRVLDSGGTLLGTLFSASNGAFGGMLPPGTYTLLARIPGRSEEYGNDITVPAVFPQVFVFPDDSCEYALEAPVLMPMSGGGGQSAVTTTAGCAWTATTDANWLTLDQPSGVGSGYVIFRAEPNTTGTLRTGTISLAGRSVSVTQKSLPAAYFAEGATVWAFDTSFMLANPSATETAHALLQFLKRDGSSAEYPIDIPPSARRTVDVVRDVPGMQFAEFSTLVESDLPIVTDRTQSWGYGAHAEAGVPAPSTDWFLAEGSTFSWGDGTPGRVWKFDLYYLIQNPGDTAATVTVRYLRPAPQPVLTKTYTVAPRSRFNIWVNDEEVPPGSGQKPLARADLSAQITSTVPVIAERAMYLSTPTQHFAAGHDSAGVTATSLDWFFAEGATGWLFDYYLLLANPYDQAAEVAVAYLLPNGTTFTKTYPVAPNSRFTILVDAEEFEATGPGVRPLDYTSVAAHVSVVSGPGIVAERAMWWRGSNRQWYEAHNSAGATTTGTAWAVADGEQGGTRGTDTYVLVANMSDQPGRVRVTLLYEDGGAPDVEEFALLPHSRFNVHPGWATDASPQFVGAADRRFATLVESVPADGAGPVQIVVERAMYWSVGGEYWAAGTAALGTKIR